MQISIQYLEPGPHLAGLTAAEARQRLQAILERLPIERVILGWSLPTDILAACAEVCSRSHAQLYLWQPLLTTDGRLKTRSEWRVVGLDHQTVAGTFNLPEFTFLCPNQPAVTEAVLENLYSALQDGIYQGVFFDRIRFPSPAADPTAQLSCFCAGCQRTAQPASLDLELIDHQITSLIITSAGSLAAARAFLSASSTDSIQPSLLVLDQLLQFRQQSITRFVSLAADYAHSLGLAVGLDCFSPTLTRMVGQDLTALSASSDWIKVMTYRHAFAPASLPYETYGLASWLVDRAQARPEEALAWLAEATGWPLPLDLQSLRGGHLPAEILSAEIKRGLETPAPRLQVGLDWVDLPGQPGLTPEQIRLDLAACRASAADGIVLSWDAWRIPLASLELLASSLPL